MDIFLVPLFKFYRKRDLDDGSVIAYKSDKFSVSKFKAVEMYHEERSKTGQIGLVLTLNHTETNEKFIVGVTHLAYNPYRGDWKMKQIIHLIAEINKQKDTGFFI